MTFFFFLTLPLVWQMRLTKQTAEGIQLPRTASHLPWGHTLLHTSPRMHFFCKWLDSSPAFTLQMQGGGKVQYGYSQLLRGGNVVVRVGGILSAQVGLLAKMPLLDQLQPRALGKQGNALYHHLSHLPSQEGWSPPLQLNTEMFSVLLLLTVKLNWDRLGPPQSSHDHPLSRGIKIDFKNLNLPTMAGVPLAFWETLIHGSAPCLGWY